MSQAPEKPAVAEGVPAPEPRPSTKPVWTSPLQPATQSEQPSVVFGETKKLRRLVEEGVLHRLLAPQLNWGNRSSLWPLMFGTACCFIEMASAAASRFDLARFGSEVMRASPRQADLMIVPGTVTKKMIPEIVRLWHQMAEPKYCIAMGACAISGGPFKEGYHVVSGVDEFVPVDVYVPGCPPKPEALLWGIIKLQEKIAGHPLPELWSADDRGAPVPLLGPDLIDERQVVEIRRRAAETPPPSVDTPYGKGKPPALVAAGRCVLDGAEELLGALALPNVAEPASDGKRTFAVGQLVEVAGALKSAGWTYLSSATGVDYADHLEVVYHFFRIPADGFDLAPGYATAERGLALRAGVERENPVVASLTPLYPGVDFQEREIYDLYGVRFEGHPHLTRILLWDEFEGHPMRKDYVEPYFEGAKPLDSRWPEGNFYWAEQKTPYGRNVRYPTDFEAHPIEPGHDRPMQEHLDALTAAGKEDEQFVINIGPQHPSTHGVFRMVATVDGETVTALTPVFGYLHRNHEKIGERNLYIQNMPFTDRLDYMGPMANNFGYALAVEKLLKVAVPERAEYIRVIMAELTRIQNHLMAIGTYINDLGAFFTPALYAFRVRESILDLFEMTAGARMMVNYFRFGGVAHDLPQEFMPNAHRIVDDLLPRAVDDLDNYLTKNEIVYARSVGVSKLTAAEALAFSISGPVLRSTGVPYDVRRAAPYSIYDRFDFTIPVGTQGDLYDRYLIRLYEVRESMKIVKQALADLPGGDIMPPGKKNYLTKPPAGEAYVRTESPKGELGFYVVSDGTTNPYRYHVRAPSFVTLQALEMMSKGHLVADLIAILGSIDINMGEVDR